MATKGHRKKPSGQFHHGDLRDAAIAVATREIETHGYAALTLQSVARQLGVTRPALYRHFADRKALLQAVAQPIFVRFEDELTRAAASHDDSWEALRAVAYAYLDFAVANRGWFRLQFVSPASERPMPDLEAAPARYFPIMIGLLDREYGKGMEHAEACYLALWGLMHGVAMLAVEQVFGMPDEQSLPILRTSIDVFIEQFRAGAAASRG